MAPRTKTAARAAENDGDVEEVFTNLDGSVDGPADEDDTSLLSDDALLQEPRRRRVSTDGISAEDLQIHADEDEDEEESEGEEAEDEPADEDEEEAADQPVAGSDFNPSDVQLLVKDAEILELRKSNLSEAKTRAESDLATAKANMKKAKEAGDTDGDIQATEDYAKAINAQQTALNGLASVTEQENVLKSRATALYAKAPKDANGKPILDGKKVTGTAEVKGPKPSKLLPKFKAANAWFGNAKFKKQQASLLAIDKGLAAENRLNKDTPEYFVELGKRFNREHPGLYKTPDGKPIATGERRRGNGRERAGIVPAGGGGGGGQRPAEGAAGKVKFTTGDVTEMRKFGMDPDDMKQRRNWLANKRELAAKEA